MLPPNFNKKLGYYRNGLEEFEHKVQAMLQGSRDHHVEFVFNNDYFDKVNWKVEPNESIEQLYYKRAKQLRERYDYIIISYTGGADSWNMLNSFLSNGLKVDEIIHVAPIAATKNLDPDPNNFEFSNFWSEYYLVTLRDLRELTKTHPEIKISIRDWSERADKFKLPDGWQMMKSHSMAPQSNDMFHLPRITDSVKKFRNIGHLIGYDKPRICIKDGKYYMYFLDFISHSTVHSEGYIDNGIYNTEFFYWAPESEQILRKQAHIVKNFFEAHPSFKTAITWPISNPANRQFYEFGVRGLVYPKYNLSTFQVAKSPTSMTMSWETLITGVNPSHGENWKKSVSELIDVLDSKYINQKKEIIGSVSGFYEI